jgi:hypothetical protein
MSVPVLDGHDISAGRTIHYLVKYNNERGQLGVAVDVTVPYWRGRPLVSHHVIIQLIANTTTNTGLKIRAELDLGTCPTGIKVSDEDLTALVLKTAKFHGDWHYAILPSPKKFTNLFLRKPLVSAIKPHAPQ